MLRAGATSGLGDRLGTYLINAMLGEIYNKDIYTTWINNDPLHHMSFLYPDNIFEYIQFPRRLKFVTEQEFNKLNDPHLDYRCVYHGFDQIPETMYKNLYEDGHIEMYVNNFTIKKN